MPANGMPYEEGQVYLGNDILKYPLQGKVAASFRFMFIAWDLLQEQVSCLVIIRRLQVRSKSTKPGISLMKLKIGSSTRPDASRVK